MNTGIILGERKKKHLLCAWGIPRPGFEPGFSAHTRADGVYCTHAACNH